MGRAAGETAPILLTAVAFFLPKLPQSVFDQVMALPYHLYIISTQVLTCWQKFNMELLLF